ncbi:MAG: retroviral-like aspartic protease family protein [Caldilineaceae bacterium]|nr:retroviral-like aspartic protease family protein [Caldilineaceae bacterium]MCB9148696.1 retroviral-like aspartic protease family protein [Caldilineaceae bacterium]
MSISFDYDLTYPGPAFPIAEISIFSESNLQANALTALVDTGADATLIPLALLESIHARRVDTKFARGINGNRYVVRLYSITITIGPYKVYGIDAVANENTSEIILGRDVLNQLMIRLDGIAQITEIEV